MIVIVFLMYIKDDQRRVKFDKKKANLKTWLCNFVR